MKVSKESVVSGILVTSTIYLGGLIYLIALKENIYEPPLDPSTNEEEVVGDIQLDGFLTRL